MNLNFEDKFLIISCMVFCVTMVIIVSLLVAGEYLFVSGVSYFAIFILVAYIQYLNLRIVYASFKKARTYLERLTTETQLLITEAVEEA